MEWKYYLQLSKDQQIKLGKIQTNKWLANVEIEEIRKQWERNGSTVDVQENYQETIDHNKNKQRQYVEQEVAQEVLVEQGHNSEQQQETYQIS